MNNDFINHALSYGDDGKKWLEQIPEIIKKYENKWKLKVLLPFNLTYNYVAPALREDGSKVVLKIGLPKDKEFQSEVSALVFFNGDSSVKILENDRNNWVILIEQVLPGKPLSEIENDEEATKILASVMNKLWKPLPKNHPFVTVKEWADSLFKYPKRFKENKNLPMPLEFAEKAILFFDELSVTTGQIVLTHADLHHDNVLSSGRGGWLSIDPKGIAAEPAYETAAMIRNPYLKLKDMKNLDELLVSRINILSKELNFDPKRIYKWCFFQTVLSGLWTIDSTKDIAHALKVAHALNRIEGLIY